jgi:hypothetical protein
MGVQLQTGWIETGLQGKALLGLHQVHAGNAGAVINDKPGLSVLEADGLANP